MRNLIFAGVALVLAAGVAAAQVPDSTAIAEAPDSAVVDEPPRPRPTASTPT